MIHLVPLNFTKLIFCNKSLAEIHQKIGINSIYEEDIFIDKFISFKCQYSFEYSHIGKALMWGPGRKVGQAATAGDHWSFINPKNNRKQDLQPSVCCQFISLFEWQSSPSSPYALKITNYAPRRILYIYGSDSWPLFECCISMYILTQSELR